MNNLFDKSDVLTVITAEQAKVGDRGYFGNSWLDLQEAIKNNYLASISTIFTGRCDCFMNNVENTIYGLFLPLDKVKNKEPVYITLTLKRNTVEDIIYMIENYIDDLYEELKMYKGSSREKSIINYIEKCKNRLKELEAFMSKDNLACEQEAKE